MKELVLLVVGFALGHVPGWLDRKRKLRTHWRAIDAEMVLLKEKSETLLKDEVRAPLYRLPVVAYETSFPILLAEGAVTEEEIKTIGRCFVAPASHRTSQLRSYERHWTPLHLGFRR
ncbi:MAG: hypothetical protein ACHBNF_19070 [Chromatiales bacterium]